MNYESNIAIGVDIGGSHIYSAAIDLTTHHLVPGTGCTEKIDNKADAEVILGGWCRAISGTMQKIDTSRLCGIGFAMPGPFEYHTGVARFERVEKFERLYGLNISDELRKRLNLGTHIHFRYINDATAFAIAEAWVGKAGASEKMIALTLGTGFGSAFLSHGIPVIEGDTVPEMGCVWHIPFQEGIADDYFSTRWFTRNYLEKAGTLVEGVKEIANNVDTNPIARLLFEKYGSNMGHFLAPWIRKFNAGVIVIGGNVTGAYSLFGPYLQEALVEEGLQVEIHISELKEDAAVIGSARLLVEEYWMNVKDLLSKM